MEDQKILKALSTLKTNIDQFLVSIPDHASDTGSFNAELNFAVNQAQQRNQWFTRKNIIQALSGINFLLNTDALIKWINRYDIIEEDAKAKQVGIIMAGNIPMVGFHDLMCVILSGHKAVVKLSDDDTVLMQFIINALIKSEPDLINRIKIVNRLDNIDAVIATGSNNTSRYFEYYFGKYPHIIRKNRNSVAIINGSESKEQLIQLGKDIFSFFGLGCRNVSKIFVPKGYSFDLFFEAMMPHASVMDHNKYMSNFDYHQAIYLLDNEPFLTNNFLIVKQSTSFSSPVAVIHYEYYNNLTELTGFIKNDEFNGKKILDQLQCIVTDTNLELPHIPFGTSQLPAVDDYADGVDTMKFLSNLI